jgi:hypothetical protein
MTRGVPCFFIALLKKHSYLCGRSKPQSWVRAKLVPLRSTRPAVVNHVGSQLFGYARQSRAAGASAEYGSKRRSRSVSFVSKRIAIMPRAVKANRQSSLNGNRRGIFVALFQRIAQLVAPTRRKFEPRYRTVLLKTLQIQNRRSRALLFVTG